MDMGPGGSYTFFKSGERPAPGMVQAPETGGNARTSWMPYVTVPNIDEALEKAKALGAKIYQEKTVMPMGSFAIMVDPQGAVLGLWEFGETCD